MKAEEIFNSFGTKIFNFDGKYSLSLSFRTKDEKAMAEVTIKKEKSLSPRDSVKYIHFQEKVDDALDMLYEKLGTVDGEINLKGLEKEKAEGALNGLDVYLTEVYRDTKEERLRVEGEEIVL